MIITKITLREGLGGLPMHDIISWTWPGDNDCCPSKRIVRMPVKKRFAKFLKDEGVFWLYVQNVKKAQGGEWFYKKARPIRYLHDAFNWGKADMFGMFAPGQISSCAQFWVKINNKWLDVLKSEGYAS